MIKDICTKSFLTAFLLSFLFTSAAEGQTVEEKLDKFFTSCHDNSVFNGTVLVAENGDIIFHDAFGAADPEIRTPLTVNSQFYLASVSKQMTCMAVMILKEEGKLNYDDKLSLVFPDFPDWADNVTIRNMMTHTSGIPNHYRLGIYEPKLTNEKVFERLKRVKELDFEPGTKYSYSNGAYVLLSVLVEKISGQRFGEFMKENIFDPLGMNRTVVYDETEPALAERTTGFNQHGKLDDYEIYTTGAGGIFTTTVDLFKWDRGLAHNKLVSQETLDEAYTSYITKPGDTTDYGFGVSIYPGGVFHTGGMNGFRTYLERNIDSAKTIIFLSNVSNLPIRSIRDGIMDILKGREPEIPPAPVSVTLEKIRKKHGIDSAVIAFNHIKVVEPERYNCSEMELNVYGYYLMGEDLLKDAVEILVLNASHHPESSNVYDSLGEAYLKSDDKENALKYYRKAFSMDSTNTRAEKIIKDIESKSGL